MAYDWNFFWLVPCLPTLVGGIWVTIQLIVVGALLGVALGTFCAWVRALGPGWARPFVAAYVELIRNTPFLIQLFFIFFGLPALGLKLSNFQAANLTMVVNLGAYSCEIIRAGIQATPKGHFEAGASLAMSPIQTFRHVVLVPALQRIWPALSSQIRLQQMRWVILPQALARGYIELFQGTPLLIQLFIAFFGLSLVGLTVSSRVAASLGLILWTAAFLAEIWRGCVESVPKGQREASASLGMGRSGTPCRPPSASRFRW